MRRYEQEELHRFMNESLCHQTYDDDQGSQSSAVLELLENIDLSAIPSARAQQHGHYQRSRTNQSHEDILQFHEQMEVYHRTRASFPHELLGQPPSPKRPPLRIIKQKPQQSEPESAENNESFGMPTYFFSSFSLSLSACIHPKACPRPRIRRAGRLECKSNPSQSTSGRLPVTWHSTSSRLRILPAS